MTNPYSNHRINYSLFCILLGNGLLAKHSVLNTICYWGEWWCAPKTRNKGTRFKQITDWCECRLPLTKPAYEYSGTNGISQQLNGKILFWEWIAIPYHMISVSWGVCVVIYYATRSVVYISVFTITSKHLLFTLTNFAVMLEMRNRCDRTTGKRGLN